MQVWCGWLDSDVGEGALARYLTFKNPQQIIIGPFSHGLDFNADTFLAPRLTHWTQLALPLRRAFVTINSVSSIA
jgi:hypothetical protein